MNDDLERRLDEWSRHPVPGPDADFAETLERDLRSQAYFSPAPAPGGPTSRIFRPALVLGITVLAVLGGWVALRDSGQPADVVMSEAMGTEIALPGEAAMIASAGSVLPDGTRIAVGRDGSAVVDGVVLGGGTEAIVVNGRIEILITEPTSTPEPLLTPRPTPTPTATLRPTTTPAPTPTVRDAAPDTTATARPDAAPTARPAQPTPTPEGRATPTADSTPEPTPTPTPEPTSTAEPTPTATPSDAPSPLTVTLRIERLSPRRALLSWRAAPRDDIRGWEVVSVVNGRVRSLALLRDPSIRELRVERPQNINRRFIVRARGADGAILAESRGVRFPTAD